LEDTEKRFTQKLYGYGAQIMIKLLLEKIFGSRLKFFTLYIA